MEPAVGAGGDGDDSGGVMVGSGGGEGYEAFVRTSRAPLWRLAVARTGDRGVAEDLVQDVLADAYRRWEHVAGYDDPLGWARRAVLNRSVSRWRRWGRESRALGRLERRRPEQGTGEPVLSDDELWSAVRALPARQQQVVLLMWFEDLPPSEVAEVIGCGPETVRTHWRRARRSLAAALGVEGGGTDGPDGDPGPEPLAERGGER